MPDAREQEAREALIEILGGLGIFSPDTTNDLMSWHRKYRCGVSREQIWSIFGKHDKRYSSPNEWREHIVDDLHAIHNPKLRVWCDDDCSRPWKWNAGKNKWARSAHTPGKEYYSYGEQFCDRCGAEKPE